MPTILLSNDDGLDAPGLDALVRALRPLGRIVVVAPDREQSGVSHALTMHHPLRARQVGEDRYSVEGTPTDCVNLAVFQLLKKSRPDLVVSGINPGYNLGGDVTYSGTVGAALEALLLQIPSIAVSRSRAALDFAAAGAVALRIASQVLAHGLPPDTLLNVNVPEGDAASMRITRQGRRIYSAGVIEHTDPKGRIYYWLGGRPPGAHHDPDSDLAAVERGEVSITPLQIDWTNHAALGALEGWDLPFAPGAPA